MTDLAISTRKAVLTPNSATQLTFTITPGGEEPLSGLTLRMELPPALLETAGNQPIFWELPPLTPGEVHQVKVVVKATNDRNLLPAAALVQAVLQAGEATIAEQELYLGIVERRGGRPDPAPVTQQTTNGTALENAFEDIGVIVPEEAAPVGATFAYTPIFDWQDPVAAATSRVLSASSAAAAPPAVDLGAVVAYKQWRLSAQLPDRAEAYLDEPLQVALDAAELIAQGVDPETLHLWAYNPYTEAWQRLPTTYDPVEKYLRAWIDNFYAEAPVAEMSGAEKSGAELTASAAQAGDGGLQLSAGTATELETSGDILPSVSAFSVDELTGSATIDIPIETPAGLGGLSPNLAFSYSSSTVDDMYRAGGPDEIEVQASAVGAGWSLRGIPYIAGECRGGNGCLDGRYSLVLDGLNSTILYNRGEWRTRPEQFVNIEFMDDSPRGGVSGVGRWVVTGKDGTIYEFGNDPGTAWRTPNNTDSAIAFFRGRTDSGSTTRFYAKRWYLRRIVDTYGNQLEIRYRAESGTETLDPVGGETWYTSMISPVEVLWNRYGGSYRMRVLFSYGTRYDTNIEGKSSSDRLQPWFGINNKLTQAQVQVWERNAWRTIRSYTPTYFAQTANSITSQRLVLRTLQVKGAQGGTLQEYKFVDTAFQGVNQVYVNTAENGLGGRTKFVLRRSSVNCNGLYCIRARVVKTVTYDGAGNNTVVYRVYGNDGDDNQADSGTQDDGVIVDEGGFLGFNQVKRIIHAQNSCSVLDDGGGFTPADATANYNHDSSCRVLQAEVIKSGMGNNTGDGYKRNPDQRATRVSERQTLAPSLASNGKVNSYSVAAKTVYDWGVLWREQNGSGAWTAPPHAQNTWYDDNGTIRYPPVWLYLRAETTTVNGAVNKSEYSYDSGAYGNVTQVRERGDGDAFLRDTLTEYFPNTSKHIVGLPARVRVYKSSSHTTDNCVQETRMVYADSGDYTTAPQRALPVRIQRPISACSGSNSISDTSGGWQIARFSRDGYGNAVDETLYNSSASGNTIINTTYDTSFGIFPRQRRETTLGVIESTEYYGVGGGPSLADGYAFFGRPSQHCAMNDICASYGYDQFGRMTRRWDNITKSSSRTNNNDGNAHVQWSYNMPGSLSGLSTYMVTEWHNPRSQGNFLRRHYDGLGQLVLEQTPYTNWTTSGGSEIHVNYAYDSLGRQVKMSVPRLQGWGIWSPAVTWSSVAHTQTEYDVLGRVTKTVAPNGQTDVYGYGVYSWSGGPGSIRATSVVAQELNGQNDKIVNWTATDALGNLAQTRTYDRSGSGWSLAATVDLRHDVKGNLTQVVHADNAGSTTMQYNLVNNRTGMNDIDLGSWSYGYDRKGNLVRQVDARGKVICLYYDKLDRLTYKHFPAANNASCPSSVSATSANVIYQYGTSGSAKGQLTEVKYSDDSYRKQLSYDSSGRLQQESVTIAGAPANPYITQYRYDAYHRLTGVKYPDGEWVNTTYNGMGLPSSLESESTGNPLSVGNVAYDESGRLTQMRLGSGSNALYRTQTYHPWTGTSYKPNGNGLLNEIKVGTSAGSSNRLFLQYGYDSFSNVSGLTERYNNGSSSTHSFTYDDQNRVTNAFGRRYTWRPNGNFATFEGQIFTYNATQVRNGVNEVNGVDRYNYDENGNMVNRGIGLPGAQVLVWDQENRLQKVDYVSSGTDESYLYNDRGQRVKRVRGNTTWYYPFPNYEVKVVTAAATPTPTPTTPPPTATPTATQTPLPTSTPTVSPSCSGFTSGWYYIKNRNSGMYLRPSGGSTANDATLVQEPLGSDLPSQQWKIESAGNGLYRVLNRKSNLYLHPREGSEMDGAALAQYDVYTGYPGEEWFFEDASSQYCWIRNQLSGKYVRPSGGSSDQTVEVLQETLNSSNNSYQWQFIAAPVDTLTPTSTPVTGVTACLAGGPRVLYRFEDGSDSTVTDLSNNGTPLNLSISGSASWLSGGGLSLDGPTTIASAGAADKIISNAVSNNALSIEVWVKPANVTQDGPARIVSISGSSTTRNVTLGQGLWGTQPSDLYNVRLRTTTNDLNGRSPDLRGPSGSATTNLQHVVYTRDAGGNARIYVDGIEVESGTIDGDLSNWDTSYKLFLGSEADGSRTWLGELHRIMIYTCALHAEDVNFLHNNPPDHSGSNPTQTPYPAATPTATSTPVVVPTPTSTPPPAPTPTPTSPPSGGCSSPAGNLVANPGFENGKSDWSFYSNGTASFQTVTEGACGQAARVAVTQAGSNIQLYQKNLALTSGVTYRLRFDARAVDGKDANLYVQRHTSPYTNFGVDGVTVDLTSSWETHELTFTAENVTTSNGRLRFDLESVEEYYLDNVSLVVVAGAAQAEAEARDAVYLPAVARSLAATATPLPANLAEAVIERSQAEETGVAQAALEVRGRVYLPAVRQAEVTLAAGAEPGTGDKRAAAAVAATTVTVRKYYFLGGRRVAMLQTGHEARELRYLHPDQLGSLVLETRSDGQLLHQERYYAFGGDRYGNDSVFVEERFTGQKLDESGLYYYNARYYDPAIGQFISPDTLVPEPGNLLAYNRYLYAYGNPLKYNDPTGHYSDEALFTHFNCDDWECVEAHFQRGGSHAGLWGWLDVLQTAEDGDTIEILALSSGNEYARITGRFATVDDRILVESGGVALFEGQVRIGSYALGGSVAEQGFASLAYLNVGGEQARSAIYMMEGYGAVGYQERRMDCVHHDCVGRATNAASLATAVVGAGCAFATAGTCVAAAGLIGLSADLVGVGRTYAEFTVGSASKTDLSVAVATAGIGAFVPAKVAPLVSGFQWWWDEYRSGEY